MTAIHSGGNWQTPGVKCSQTIETAPIPVGIPFSSSVKGVALMDDSISLQASLECRYNKINIRLNLLYLSYIY